MSDRPRLVSVHFPKAGGTSTTSLLRSVYGEHLLLDYDDDPTEPLSIRQLDPERYMRRRVRLAPEVRAVHGHFHPAKYLDEDPAIWFTVLRHPVPWMVSLYWFWRSAAEGLLPEGRTIWGHLHEYMADARLGLEETARLPMVKSMFTKNYFENIDMARFDYIGRHEDRRGAIAALSGLVGQELSAEHRENSNPSREEIGDSLSDTRLIARLTDLLKDEIAFYERWTAKS
jgi:hypothetical protein